ncbi:MAG: polyprenyl synthetase family protein [Flavobacteriaceae bacterium]|nr:polyprenyl synthetase family protein [Flavobacteriaceae bacterium]
MEHIAAYQKQFLDFLNNKKWPSNPERLYAPITYILGLGGKRLRPVLTLMGANAFGQQTTPALPAALAVELFHNFTLLHDDIMDDAPLRRGKPTVHTKWDNNLAILSGDALLIAAYQALEAYEESLYSQLTRVLSKTAIEVCEGQQYDMDFEKRTNVSEGEYLHIIKLKTAVLVGCALKMGALIAGASLKQSEEIYQIGESIGLAFQIQDDYLDAFGDPKSFGKQVGGDIIENKKTMLYYLAIELGTDAQKKELITLFSTRPQSPVDKIKTSCEIFYKTGAQEACRAKVNYYTNQALDQLKALSLNESGKNEIEKFAKALMARSF